LDIKRIIDRFFAPGSEDAGFLDRFVQGLVVLPLTKGSLSGLPSVPLRASHPLPETYPSLLFAGLPESSSNDTPGRHPTSDAILQHIKRCSAAGMTVPIFGVSGCGKTRGILELLSRRWGFYFNASSDDLGSADIVKLMGHLGTRLEKDPATNNRHARTITYLLLLSRLKIFQHCLAIPGSHQTFTSARWTILQTCVSVFPNNIFLGLFEKLLPLLPQHPTSEAESELVTAVKEEFGVTVEMLVRHGKHGGLPPVDDGAKLLVVLDEAQILGETEPHSFRSMSLDQHHRPLLSPVLWGFRTISEVNQTLIACGTGRSVYTLDWARSSGSFSKAAGPLSSHNEFEFMEFPGWTGRESIEAYLASLRCMLPTASARESLDKLFPSEAIQAISERFVGRFRPAVSCIEFIIARNDPGSWEYAVDDREERLVSYEYCSMKGNLCHELVHLENKCRMHMHLPAFKDLRSVEEVLGLLLFQRYMFGADSLVFEKAVPELVEHAFGRIKIIDNVVRTVLDEPFVLLAAENYFKNRDSDFMKTMSSWVQMSDRPQAHGYAWELMMMSVLTDAFKNHAFSEWPQEPLIPLFQGGDVGNATIVGLGEQGVQRGISHKHISMKDFMLIHVKDGSMRSDGRPVPPFFFRRLALLGPTLCFSFASRTT